MSVSRTTEGSALNWDEMAQERPRLN